MSETSAPMQFLGEDPDSRKWFFADNSFSKPGIYFWDGETNVHVQELIEKNGAELANLKSENAKLKEELEVATKYAICAYCQTRLPKDPLAIVEHMGECEKSPWKPATEMLKMGEAMAKENEQLHEECEKLRADIAARDSIIEEVAARIPECGCTSGSSIYGCKHNKRTLLSALSPNPPVYVPGEIVEKLVGCIDAISYTPQSDEEMYYVECQRLKEALALARPFITKGEKS